MKSSPRKIPTLTRAFSLVETALAIGIVAFAMIGILGMIPVGLTTFRSAMNRTVESAIVQSVSATLQLVDLDNLPPESQLPEFYFDEQGNRLGNNVGMSAYLVKAEGPLPLASGDSASSAENNLVSPEAGYRILFTVTSTNGATASNRYSVIIPRNR